MTIIEGSHPRDAADEFHALHHASQPLVLPNAWDVLSARLVERAGARAIATTSSGVAWTLGAPDGDAVDRELVLGAIGRIVDAVQVPVTADIEAGFGQTPEAVGETARCVLAAGAVGVNIEDSDHGRPGSLRPLDDQVARLSAAREAASAVGVRLFVNARIDVFLRGLGEPEARLASTLARARAYVDAGADGVFVPGVTDLSTISALAEGISVPLNVLAGPGAPSTGELGAAGARRVSLGGALAESAYALVRRAAAEALERGTYGALTEALSHGEVNALYR